MDMSLKTIKRNSVLYAAFISVTIICSIISTLISIPRISVVVTFILFMAAIINNRTVSYKLAIGILSCGITISIFWVNLLLNFSNVLIEYLIYFIVFGITGFYFNVIKIDEKLVYKTLYIVYGIYLVLYISIIRAPFLEAENYSSIQMGKAYSFLPIILLTIIIIFFYKEYRNKIFYLGVGAAALYFMTVDCVTRGVLVAIAMLFIFVMIAVQKTALRKLALFLLILVGCLFVIYNVIDILYLSKKITNEIGIEVGAIEKALWQFETRGTMDNGRDKLISQALLLIRENWVTGFGIGYYEQMNNGIYPHNIILELMTEFGVIGTFVILLILGKGIFLCMDNSKIRRNDDKILGLFLFSISIPQLCFSLSYWLLPSFWLFFSWSLYRFSERGKRSEERVGMKC